MNTRSQNIIILIEKNKYVFFFFNIQVTLFIKIFRLHIENLKEYNTFIYNQ